MSYNNNNSGILNKNEDKRKQDAKPNWPDYKGFATVAGQEYHIGGWIRQRKDGTGLFLSLAFTPKEDTQQAPPAQNQSVADEMPF